MKRGKKTLLAVAALFIAAGCILAAGGYAMAGDDWAKLSSEKTEANTHMITESFERIHIHAGSSDIQILPSWRNECTVVCNDSESLYHTVTVEDGVLSIIQDAEFRFFRVMLLPDPAVTVYLPVRQYRELYIAGSSGDILEVSSELAFEKAVLSTSSGDIQFHGAVDHDLTVKTSSGNIDIENCRVDGSTQVKATSGSVNIDGMHTGEFTVSTSSGDVQLASIAAKNLHASAISGGISISSCEAEQNVSVETTSGDLTLADINAGGVLTFAVTSAQVDLANTTGRGLVGNASSGDICLRNVRVGGQLSLESTSGLIRLDGSDAGSLLISSSSGDVSGSLLTPKFFVIRTTSGEVNVTESDRDGGRCEITTSSGDIQIRIHRGD